MGKSVKTSKSLNHLISGAFILSVLFLAANTAIASTFTLNTTSSKNWTEGIWTKSAATSPSTTYPYYESDNAYLYMDRNNDRTITLNTSISNRLGIITVYNTRNGYSLTLSNSSGNTLTATTLYLGSNAAGTSTGRGIYTQGGGTTDITTINIGVNGTGTYNLNGGTLTAGTVNLDGSGTGSFIQSSGTNATITTFNYNGGTLTIPNSLTASSIGTFNYNSGGSSLPSNLNQYVITDFVLTNGSLTHSSLTLQDAAAKGIYKTYSINGGYATIDDLSIGTGGILNVTYGGQNRPLTMNDASITNNGTINIGSTSSSALPRMFLNASATSVAISGTGIINLGIPGSSSGSTGNHIYTGTTTRKLTNGTGHTIQGYGSIGYIGNSDYDGKLALQNNGIIKAVGGTLTLDASANFGTGNGITNSGTFEVASGATMTIVNADTGTAYQTFKNYNASTNSISGGIYKVAGTLRLPSSISITTNAATIELDGASSNIYTGGSGETNALTNLATNNGTFTLKNGRTFKTAGDFDNTGTINLDGTDTKMEFTGNAANSGTFNMTNNSTVQFDAAFSGFSTFQNLIINAGGYFSGASPYTFTIRGNFTNNSTTNTSAGSTINFDNGLATGSAHTFTISGNETWDTLELGQGDTLYLTGGSLLKLNDLLLNWDLSGAGFDSFASVIDYISTNNLISAEAATEINLLTLSYLNGGTKVSFDWDKKYVDGNVTYTPIPGTLLMLGTGLLGLLGIRRRFAAN